jgi:hypothetical protein
LHRDISGEALSHLRTRRGKTPEEARLEDLLREHVQKSPYWFSKKAEDGNQGNLF